MRFKATESQVKKLAMLMAGNTGDASAIFCRPFNRHNTLAVGVVRPKRVTIYHDLTFVDVFYCLERAPEEAEFAACGITDRRDDRPSIIDFPGEDKRISNWPVYNAALERFGKETSWETR